MQATDQLGRVIELTAPPARIISCIPSTTELLFDLGLDQEVIGITKFCVHPKSWHTPIAIGAKTRIGGTKNFNFEKIASLNPDLIICDKEENKQEQVEELMQHDNVTVSDTNNLQQALDMIKLIGILTNKKARSSKIIDGIRLGFDTLGKSLGHLPPKSAVYLIWNEPIMVAGSSTFIDDMMVQCGLKNLFPFGENGYPKVTPEELQKADPDLLLLSSEPFPFAEKHLAVYQKMLVNTKVVLVDGEMFSWPGSRLEKAAGYFDKIQDLLHII